MNLSLVFTRIFFAILSIFFMTTYMFTAPGRNRFINGLIGAGIGALFTLLLYGFDRLFRRFNLRTFNIAIVGLFFGYLMGLALLLIFNVILDISSISIALAPHTLEIIKIGLFLFGTYLGSIMTLRAADEIYVSVPFVKFTPMAQRRRDLVIDASAISDARLIDLCTTGLLDHQIVIPRFVMNELHSEAESQDEQEKARARNSLEVIKKLESIPELKVRFNETDFPEIHDGQQKLLRLARLLDANLLSADITKAQLPAVEGTSVINMHSLSNALKPLSATGEIIQIKVQRLGKETNQGVGYLEDGTMVVINGGGDFIGETINCQVLSVKHTSSGRMIFCNAMDIHEPGH